MIKLSGTDSVVSVCKAEHNPYYVMKKVRNNYLSDLFNRKKIYARQQAPNVYRINGSLYVAKRDIIMQKKVVTSKTRPLIMPHEFSVDIDSHLDLQYAEFLLKNSKRIQNSS